MSSAIEFASQIVNDDISHVEPLLRLIVHISDTPRDPLKAAYRTEVINYLCAQTPEFSSLCDEIVQEAEEMFEASNQSPASATH